MDLVLASNQADADWEPIDVTYDGLHTPTSSAGDHLQQQLHYHTAGAATNPESDEEPETIDHVETVPRRKPGGYDSRIEQILYENPELPILITDAGKSLEGSGRYTVYTIRTGVSNLLCISQFLHHLLLLILPLSFVGF
jgi:hypothetical protein